jgi:hypothetical protein
VNMLINPVDPFMVFVDMFHFCNEFFMACIVNELIEFVYDILAQRIIAVLSKLKLQLLSSLTINKWR